MNGVPFSMVPPHSPEAEQAAVGAMMNDPEALAMAQADVGITPRMFYFPQNQIIAEACMDLAREKKGLVDALLLTSKLRVLGLLDDVGGLNYLQECVQMAPVSAYAREHMETVKHDYYRRETINVSRHVVDIALKAEDRGFLEKIPQLYFDLMPKGQQNVEVADLCRASVERVHRLESGEQKLAGLSTGFPTLDKVLCGLQPGLYVIAGRPGQGKSSIAGTIDNIHLEQGIACARVSMDMDPQSVVDRDISRQSLVSLPKINGGYAGGKNKAQWEQAAARIAKWPLHIFPGGTDVLRQMNWIRLMHARHGIKIVTVDYLQQCTVDHGKGWSQERIVSYVTESYKALGLELNVPVLGLAQFSRAGEKDNRRPRLSDLRDSGTLEQAAKVVVFLYKAPDFDYALASTIYKRPILESKNRAVICEVAKNQQGGVGTLPLWFRCSYFRLDEAEKGWGIDYQINGGSVEEGADG